MCLLPPAPPPSPSSREVVFRWRSVHLDVLALFHCVSRKSLLFPPQEQPGQSVRLAEVNTALAFRRGAGYLWEQQFGGGD